MYVKKEGRIDFTHLPTLFFVIQEILMKKNDQIVRSRANFECLVIVFVFTLDQ